MWCWGRLADPTGVSIGDRTRPEAIRELTGAVDVALGLAASEVCAQHRDGSVSCVGGRFHCDQPDGQQPVLGATTIVGIEGARHIAGGAGYFCANTPGDVVRCWGIGNAAYDRTRRCGAPPSAFDLAGVRGLGLDGLWTCAELGQGGVSCWGERVPGASDATFATPHRLVAEG